MTKTKCVWSALRYLWNSLGLRIINRQRFTLWCSLIILTWPALWSRPAATTSIDYFKGASQTVTQVKHTHNSGILLIKPLLWWCFHFEVFGAFPTSRGITATQKERVVWCSRLLFKTVIINPFIQFCCFSQIVSFIVLFLSFEKKI